MCRFWIRYVKKSGSWIGINILSATLLLPCMPVWSVPEDTPEGSPLHSLAPHQEVSYQYRTVQDRAHREAQASPA
jgi:hypothetical protein